MYEDIKLSDTAKYEEKNNNKNNRLLSDVIRTDCLCGPARAGLLKKR